MIHLRSRRHRRASVVLVDAFDAAAAGFVVAVLLRRAVAVVPCSGYMSVRVVGMMPRCAVLK